MEPIVQQPYNLFAQQKQQYYPSSQNQQVQQQAVVPGNTQGATQQIPTDVAAKMQQLENESMAWRTPGIAHGGKGMLEHGGIAGTVKNTNVGTGNLKVTDSPTYPAATETGGGTKPITSMEDLATAMGYTSPQEEDRLRKASIANQRILAVGDALRHIGNIAHTVNYAPSQQFNSPVEAERQRYLQGKAVRDKANQIYLSYQQQKAEQDRKAKQWEATFNYNAAKDAAAAQALKEYRDAGLKQKDRIADQNLAFNRDKQKATEERWKRQDENTERHQRRMEGIAGMNAQTNRDRATAYINHLNSSGGSGGRGSGSGRGQNTIYSRRGYLTKAGATDADMKRIYDNMYEWGKAHGKRGADGRVTPYIDEGGILAGINPDLLGGKKISDVSKREAVDKMIMEHDDAAVQLHAKHGFEWHEQKPNDKKDPYSQYVVQSNGNNSGTDYSQYKRK